MKHSSWFFFCKTTGCVRLNLRRNFGSRRYLVLKVNTLVEFPIPSVGLNRLAEKTYTFILVYMYIFELKSYNTYLEIYAKLFVHLEPMDNHNFGSYI